MNKMIINKSKEELQKEWDLLADLRNKQLLDEVDISYSYVIITNILKMYNFNDQDYILDIGCGTGMIPKYLENKFKKYIGVDFSHKMIQHAKKNASNLKKISFVTEPIEEA